MINQFLILKLQYIRKINANTFNHNNTTYIHLKHVPNSPIFSFNPIADWVNIIIIRYALSIHYFVHFDVNHKSLCFLDYLDYSPEYTILSLPSTFLRVFNTFLMNFLSIWLNKLHIRVPIQHFSPYIKHEQNSITTYHSKCINIVPTIFFLSYFAIECLKKFLNFHPHHNIVS